MRPRLPRKLRGALAGRLLKDARFDTAPRRPIWFPRRRRAPAKSENANRRRGKAPAPCPRVDPRQFKRAPRRRRRDLTFKCAHAYVRDFNSRCPRARTSVITPAGFNYSRGNNQSAEDGPREAGDPFASALSRRSLNYHFGRDAGKSCRRWTPPVYLRALIRFPTPAAFRARETKRRGSGANCCRAADVISFLERGFCIIARVRFGNYGVFCFLSWVYWECCLFSVDDVFRNDYT